MSRRRKKARTFGLHAESLAAAWLRLKFYKIFARNFSSSGAAIDLTARRGDVIAFVEVKARPSLELAGFAISADEAVRISGGARA
jgi:putative endonuclease